MRTGLLTARWPGRLEVLDGGRVGLRRVLLDGAHNPDGAAALARALGDLGLRRPAIVFGAMRGKKVRAVLAALAPLEPRFVFTRVDDPGAHEPGGAGRDLARDSADAASPRRIREPRSRVPMATRSSSPDRSISSAPCAA